MQASSEQEEKAFPRLADFAKDARVEYVDEAGRYIFTDPKDGMKYEYDPERSAWFPMWDESLVSKQQSAYGIVEHDTNNGEHHQSAKRKIRKVDRRKENTSIYISGLPADTTDGEVAQYFSQCGAIMPDILTGSLRVKLYRDEKGNIKGDALVTYYKAPSVQLAVNILDDSQFRASEPTRISVQEAEFREREGKDVEHERKADAYKPKRTRIDTNLARKQLGQLERKLDWSEDSAGIAERYRRTVILKHMFTIGELEKDVTLLLDLTEDVRTECEKLGTVTSVKIFDRSEEGVIAVKFKSEAVAKACVKAMNGRFFSGRQIEAEIYNGRARYKSSIKNKSDPDSAGKIQDEDEECSQ